MSCLARGLAWRTMSAVAFIIASVSLYALVASQQQSPAPYVLRVMREDESSQGSAVDLMTLQCLDSSDQVMRPQEVVFWLNRNAPNDPDFKDRDYVIVDNDLREIVFQLREEGNYTCGIRTDVANVEESEPVPLIALQTIFGDLELRTTTRYFVAAGGTIQLHCPVQPRGLSNYYYGQWKRNGTTIIEVPRPSNDGQIGSITRNSSEISDLDRDSFTLTLRSVNRSQASDNYRCVLHNLNPSNGIPQQFTQAMSLRISLMVDERPSVLKRPEAVIIGLQNATTNPPTFTCVVGGAPAPTLFWTYIPGLDEGRSILLLDGDEYDVSSNTTVQDNGLVMVTSTVTFLKVVNTDGGIVRCNARPGSAYENALLTVLGTADDIDVFISREGDVIYELVFPVEIQHPVTLSITYTSDSGQTDGAMPDIRYNSTRTISYRDSVSDLPFPVYTVSIGLIGVNGNERIAGPATEYGQIDTTKPDQITVIAISVGSVLGFVSIVLLNVVAITIVTCCIFGHQQKKLSLEYTQKVIDDPEEYTKHLETEEARKKFMHKVMKTHSKSMGLGPIRTDDGAEEDITDLFIQVLLEGLGSDSKSKTNFIEAVKHEILTTPPNVERDKDPAVQSSLDDTEVEVRRENAAYHSGRDVSKDAVIEMSPIGGRRSTGGTTKVVIETSERTAV